MLRIALGAMVALLLLSPAVTQNAQQGRSVFAANDHTPKKQCLIKGNISSKGERIYHVPGERWYGATKITRTKGERWFCSEVEALNAGWRKSKQ
ncbi:MAG: hypothetical protein RIE56_11770 [Amphiplicatus sp.]